MKAEILVWLKQAERDFRSARHSLSARDYYVCALLCQQAVEKALKYLHLRRGGPLIRTHDVVKLAREIVAPGEIIMKCSELSPVYTEVRYPETQVLPASKVNRREAEHFLQLAKEILQWVKKQP